MVPEKKIECSSRCPRRGTAICGVSSRTRTPTLSWLIQTCWLTISPLRCCELLNFALTQLVSKSIKRVQLILVNSIQPVRVSDLQERASLWLET